MTHAYVDVATIQTTDPGDPLTAAWCDQVRDNQEVFIDPPSCAIYSTTHQSIANGTNVALNAASELYDNDSMHSTITQNTRIIIQTAGRYLIQGIVEHDSASSTGLRAVRFIINGSDVLTGLRTGGATGYQPVVNAVRTHVFAQGDYVECQAFQNAGSSQSVTLLEFGTLFLTR